MKTVFQGKLGPKDGFYACAFSRFIELGDSIEPVVIGEGKGGQGGTAGCFDQTLRWRCPVKQ